MSKSAIELLRVIGLLDAQNRVVDLRAIPEDQLSGRLAYYYEKRCELANGELEALSVRNLKNAALVSSVSSANSVVPLCPKFLAQETIIADDPVFQFAAPRHPMSDVQNEALGLVNRGVDVGRLQNKLLYFQSLGNFMEAGILHSLPLAILHRAPDQVPVYAPENLYRELVPDGARELIRQAAQVSPLRRVEGGLIVDHNAVNERTRQVCITFNDDASFRAGYMYFFRQMQITGRNSDGTYSFSQEIWNDEPLDKAQYDLWIEQSINSAVGNRLTSVGKEIALAGALGAQYMTESNFEAELLARAVRGARQEPAAAINFLEANLDRLRLDDPEKIFRLREDHGDLLGRFRSSLEETASKLIGIAPEEYPEKATRLFTAEIQPQIDEIAAIVQKLPEAVAKGAIQTGIAVVLAIMTGTAVPLCAALPIIAGGAGAESIPAVGEYIRARRQPEFLWYKLGAA